MPKVSIPQHAQDAPPNHTDTSHVCLQCASLGETCCVALPEQAHLAFPLSPKEWARIAPYDHLASLSPDLECAEGRLEVTPVSDSQYLTPATDSQATTFSTTSQEVAPTLDSHDTIFSTNSQGAKPTVANPMGQVAEYNTAEFIEAVCGLFSAKDKAKIERLFPMSDKHFRLRTRADGSCVFLGKAGCRLPRSVRPWYCLLFPLWFSEGEILLFAMESCLVARQALSPAHGLRMVGMTQKEALDLFQKLRADWGI